MSIRSLSTRTALLLGAVMLLPSALPLPAQAAGCPTWTVVVRDFSQSHPDFEAFSGDDRGIVLPDLGSDGKPVYAGPNDNPTTTLTANFDQWFRDVSGVNQSTMVDLALQPTGTAGICGYSNAAFFPIDGQLLGNEGQDHNYDFTVEAHGQVHYAGGEVLHFRSQDDLWVFVNHKLVLDLGGVHFAEDSTVVLDDVAGAAGLTPGTTYDLDLFFANRSREGSQLAFEIAVAPAAADMTPPVITCPADTQLTATQADGAFVDFTVTATDDVTASPVIVSDPPSGSLFPIGTTTVTSTATDEADNSSSCSFTVTVTAAVTACPRGLGWWKNHPSDWPVESLDLGSGTYDQAALLALLKSPVRGDATIILLHQLIPAKLNVAAGAPSDVIAAAIADADALIGDTVLPPDQPVPPSSPQGQAMVHLSGRLGSYDEGGMTPDCHPGDGTDDGSKSIHLGQNHPNPFADTNQAMVELREQARVRLSVVDLRGRVVRVLLDREQAAGTHAVEWNGRNAAGRKAPKGVYFYVLERPDRAERVLQKVILAR